MLCELSLLFNKKEGVKEQFPEFTENSFCEKLWNHLDNRELRDFKVKKNKKIYFYCFPQIIFIRLSNKESKNISNLTQVILFNFRCNLSHWKNIYNIKFFYSLLLFGVQDTLSGSTFSQSCCSTLGYLHRAAFCLMTSYEGSWPHGELTYVPQTTIILVLSSKAWPNKKQN